MEAKSSTSRLHINRFPLPPLQLFFCISNFWSTFTFFEIVTLTCARTVPQRVQFTVFGGLFSRLRLQLWSSASAEGLPAVPLGVSMCRLKATLAPPAEKSVEVTAEQSAEASLLFSCHFLPGDVSLRLRLCDLD